MYGEGHVVVVIVVRVLLFLVLLLVVLVVLVGCVEVHRHTVSSESSGS